MGHNVSKKSKKTTEINSVSIRQSMANGDVEIAEHGTLSGNPERGVWRSDLTKSLRKSLKHSGKSKTKTRTLNNGFADDRTQLTAPAREEPDLTSSPVFKPVSRGRIPVETNNLGLGHDDAKSAKRKNPNRPYRNDNVQAIRPSKDTTNFDAQNGHNEREVVGKTVVTKFNDKEYNGENLKKTPAVESDIDEEKCSFQRFEKQRSTTRRKSKKTNKGRAGADSTGKTLSKIINRDEQSTTGQCDEATNGDQGEPQSQNVFISPTKLYNILNDGGTEVLREIDKNHIVLFDTRAMDDYERAHIIGAQQINLNQSDLGVDLSVAYSWVVLYDEDGQSHFSSQSVLTATLDRLAYLGHRAKILQGGFDSFVNKYPFMCQTEETPICNDILHYPSEIIRNRLYLGCVSQATDPGVVSDLGIVYVLNIGTEVVKPISGHGRVMNLQFRENSKNDLLQVMPQVLSVVSSALEEKAAKILVTCSTGNNKSAAVIALYLMHKKKWPMERALRFISSGRQSIELSAGVNQQLQRCEKFVFQAY